MSDQSMKSENATLEQCIHTDEIETIDDALLDFISGGDGGSGGVGDENPPPHHFW